MPTTKRKRNYDAPPSNGEANAEALPGGRLGKRKVPVEEIGDEKKRKEHYNKKRKFLIRSLKEFNTKTGLNCLIMFESIDHKTYHGYTNMCNSNLEMTLTQLRERCESADIIQMQLADLKEMKSEFQILGAGKKERSGEDTAYSQCYHKLSSQCDYEINCVELQLKAKISTLQAVHGGPSIFMPSELGSNTHEAVHGGPPIFMPGEPGSNTLEAVLGGPPIFMPSESDSNTHEAVHGGPPIFMPGEPGSNTHEAVLGGPPIFMPSEPGSNMTGPSYGGYGLGQEVEAVHGGAPIYMPRQPSSNMKCPSYGSYGLGQEGAINNYDAQGFEENHQLNLEFMRPMYGDYNFHKQSNMDPIPIQPTVGKIYDDCAFYSSGIQHGRYAQSDSLPFKYDVGNYNGAMQNSISQQTMNPRCSQLSPADIITLDSESDEWDIIRVDDFPNTQVDDTPLGEIGVDDYLTSSR